MIELLSNATAISPGHSMPFEAIGGVPPYTYQVVMGGAGGVIDENTGQYTAPKVKGKDTVIVSDVNGASTYKEILVGGPVELVCDIIRSELGLDADQVVFYNQKYDIPPDTRLHIAVRILSARPFGNSRRYVDTPGGLQQVQTVNMQVTLSIDVISKGLEAVERKEEVLLSLKSDYATQQQALNTFHLGTLPTSFIDISDEEGAARLYKYSMSINVQYFISKIKDVGYYNQFPGFTVTEEK